jgi:hypothetical protein
VRLYSRCLFRTIRVRSCHDRTHRHLPPRPSRGSPEEAAFLDAARELASIPGTLDYTIKRQTSPKLDHRFGIAMRFASEEDYAAYNAHPLHTRFLEEHWFPEVA